ncbi:MAG: multidrug effflux MFS transporter [Pseudonocardia sp.]|nr:multidrug effflux MFS transporter [Pseudonocardia sp.]
MFALWISVLALLTAIAPLATDMYLPAFPTIASDLGTTASGVQLTLTAFLVGLALGQLVIGPLSDGWGRRRLLIAGTAVCALAGVAVAFSPSVEFAVVVRFVQGFSGAAGIVLARAVIVDRTTGARTASLFALMMAIGGVAPVIAPLLGSALVGVIGWRGIFVVLGGLAAVMLLGVLTVVPESLPVERRRSGGLSRTFRDVGAVLRRPRYVGYTLSFALAFSAMFAYISGSPVVLQDTLGLSTTAYALTFAANATGLVLVTVLSARLVRTVAPRRLLMIGVASLIVMSTALLVVVLLGAPTAPVLLLLFLAVSSLGLIMGNATALASDEVRDLAGTGSALLGALQFGLGAVVSPLVGASATTMAAVMLIASVLAATALLLTRAPARQPVTVG